MDAFYPSLDVRGVAHHHFHRSWCPAGHDNSIVYAFKRGAAPESMQRAFPILTLEEIYGAITFYLAHKQEIDAYLAQAEAAFELQASALNSAARTAKPALFQRLERARHARETTHQ
jgi:hypothetical protein